LRFKNFAERDRREGLQPPSQSHGLKKSEDGVGRVGYKEFFIYLSQGIIGCDKNTAAKAVDLVNTLKVDDELTIILADYMEKSYY
jgi:hypothetical protein